MKSIPSLPLDLLESIRYVVSEAQSFEFKGLTGKIRKTKELAPVDRSACKPLADSKGLTSKILETKELTPQDHFVSNSPYRSPIDYGAVGGALSQRTSGKFA